MVSVIRGFYAVKWTHSGIEETSRHSEEDPCRHSKRKPESDADEHQLVERRITAIQGIGSLCRGESEEKEEKGANELAGHGDEMTSPISVHVSIALGISWTTLNLGFVVLVRVVPLALERVRHDYWEMKTILSSIQREEISFPTPGLKKGL